MELDPVFLSRVQFAFVVSFHIVFPAFTARVAIEQASTFGWERYVGPTGRVIGMHTFGASAPLKALQQEFGFTVENVVAAAKAQLERR